ncbi:hypothetical protein B0T10DRAFT_591874 [Thelonectria olida]|uniref:ABM domain-containing protein n=1 Tax=Thelonectria olida TaxID=1576542 RepID=A0A9P8W7E5_9HYPO|nr:hypothetical protein B0T10DRAFT_591874 [Thelonectria olida]
MVITEVGCMGVKPGLNIMDQAILEGEILTQAWKTVTTKPGGPYRVYWGLEKVDPSKVWAFFDWGSVEQHDKFAKEHGAAATQDIPKICTHGEFTKHIGMVPSSDVLRSPVTEVVLVYFPADCSQTEKDKASAQLQHLLAKNFSHCPDITKLAHGWGLENDFPVRGKGKNGQVGSVLLGFIGWSSSVAQTRFHETSTYKETVTLMQDMNGVVSFDILSMSCDHLERHTEQ